MDIPFREVAGTGILMYAECQIVDPCLHLTANPGGLGVTDGHDPTRMLFEVLDDRRLSVLNAALFVEQGPQPCDCWNAKTLLSSRA